MLPQNSEDGLESPSVKLSDEEITTLLDSVYSYDGQEYLKPEFNLDDFVEVANGLKTSGLETGDDKTSVQNNGKNILKRVVNTIDNACDGYTLLVQARSENKVSPEIRKGNERKIDDLNSMFLTYETIRNADFYPENQFIEFMMVLRGSLMSVLDLKKNGGQPKLENHQMGVIKTFAWMMSRNWSFIWNIKS